MFANKKRFILTALVLVCTCHFFVFAQSNENISEVYKQIDMAVAAKNADTISAILKENRESSVYPMIEAYTLKKTRQLIISDNLEVARQTSLAVIDNNIENFDAVELYSYIDKAILNQQAAEQAAENRKRLEQERIAALNAKSKAKLASRGNYQIVNTASGQEVYINEQQASFSPIVWTVRLGLADFLYQKITEPSYASLKYGLAVGGDLFYPSERFVFGTDVFVDAQILTMGDGEQEFFVSGKLVPQIAFVDFTKSLFLRFGLSANMLASKVRDVTNSTDTFVSPVVGIALDNFYIGDTRLKLYYDYDFGHVAYADIKAAMEFGGSVLLPLAVNDKTKVGIELGVQDLLFMKEEGIENRTKFTFAIGVGNVTK